MNKGWQTLRENLHNMFPFSSILRFVFLNLFLWQYGYTILEVFLYTSYAEGGEKKSQQLHFLRNQPVTQVWMTLRAKVKANV